MNPKQKLIEMLVGPIMNMFEQKLKISGLFVGVIILVIEFPFFMKNKSKENHVIVAKIIYVLTLIIGFIAAIKYTIDLRSEVFL